MQAMAVPLKFLVDFALPPRCPACGVITPEQNQFCAECWQKLQLLSEPACATCDLPLPYAAADGTQCAACLKSPPRHAGVKAVAAYGDVTREIALKLKHGGKIGLARMIARMLQRYARAIPDDAIITPVPLHWTRLWSRRYNQSALISAELARNSGHQHIPTCCSAPDGPGRWAAFPRANVRRWSKAHSRYGPRARIWSKAGRLC